MLPRLCKETLLLFSPLEARIKSPPDEGLEHEAWTRTLGSIASALDHKMFPFSLQRLRVLRSTD
jgi:hypothetical protein